MKVLKKLDSGFYSFPHMVVIEEKPDSFYVFQTSSVHGSRYVTGWSCTKLKEAGAWLLPDGFERKFTRYYNTQTEAWQAMKNCLKDPEEFVRNFKIAAGW